MLHLQDCKCCSPIYASERASAHLQEAAFNILFERYWQETKHQRVIEFEEYMQQFINKLDLEINGHRDFIC